MKGRRGFTLIELMVGLVISGLVVALGYGALQGGLDTQTRLTSHRDSGEAGLAARALLTDALRHALPGVPGGPESFTLSDRITAAGTATDSITFLTRGIVPPLGTSGAWRATISLRRDSLRFVAWPPEGGVGAPIRATVHAGDLLDVQVLGRGALATWSPRWDDSGVAPEAVRLATRSGEPLVVRVGLERAP